MADSSSSQSSHSVKHGKVKWFNNAKGYGFINEIDKTEDLFAHYSAIEMDGYKTLKAGQAVDFEVIQGPKGLHAVKIKAPTDVQPAHHAGTSSPTHRTANETV
ncbi:MAG: cold shock protein CspD [Pseudomonas sp.]|nr:cold shock protein CspD [Pseudomonas sp.]